MKKRLIFLIAVLMGISAVLSGCGDAAGDAAVSQSEENNTDNGNVKRTLSPEAMAANQKNIFYQNITDLTGADPFVLCCESGEYAGSFLMYSTSRTLSARGFEVYQSRDLTHWEKLQDAFYPQGGTWGDTKMWAPEVIEDNGLYYLFYSAQWGSMEYGLYISVAASSSPAGPFNECVTDTKSVMEPLIRFEKHTDEIPEELRSALKGHDGTEGYIKVIDASPFVDPETGKKYLYMIADLGTTYTEASFVMGMEMEDWTTPKYETLTRLTEYGLTTPGGSEVIFDGGNTNEGCSVLYHEGRYYLTFSTFTYTSTQYQVRQAIGESPLGPFVKVQPEDGGTVISTEIMGIRQSAGHSSFFTVGDELWLSYHTFYNDSTIDDGRKPAVEKLVFVENSKGQKVLQANGPTSSPQLMPRALAGCGNIADQAQVSCDNTAPGSDIKLLTDGFVPMHKITPVPGFEADAGETTITFAFDDFVKLRNVLIYNSFNETKRFTGIKAVLLETDQGEIDLGPLEYSSAAYDEKGKTAYDYPAAYSFAETKVKTVTIQISSDVPVEIPEIYLAGRN